MKKNRQRDKEIKSEGGWLRQRRERRGGGHERTFKSILVFCQVIFISCLVFSPSPVPLFLCMSLAKHTIALRS